MAIEMVKIRAKVSVGAGLIVETPFIRSFSVSKSRGQISSFNAVLKVPHDSMGGNLSGDNIAIEAGIEGNLIKIFTGMIKQAKISPSWDDPYYVDLSISGVDVLYYLQGKKFTRRCRSSKSSWVSINGVSRPGLKSGKFKYVEDPFLETSVDDPTHAGHITWARNVALSDLPKSAGKSEIAIIPRGVKMPIVGEE